MQNSQINIYFDSFDEIIVGLMKIGIKNNNESLIDNAIYTLINIIINSTPDLSNNLVILYNKALDFLVNRTTYDYVPEINFNIQSSLCSIISTVLYKLKEFHYNNFQIDQDIIEILYDMLNSKNMCIYEECLMTISAIINSLYIQRNLLELLTPNKIKVLITEFVFNGIKSMNPNIIKASCNLISNIYYFLSKSIPDLHHYIPSIFDDFSYILLKHNELRV